MEDVPSQTSPLGLTPTSEGEARNTEAIKFSNKVTKYNIKIMVSSGELDLPALPQGGAPCWRRFDSHLECGALELCCESRGQLDSLALLPAKLQAPSLTMCVNLPIILCFGGNQINIKKENRRENEEENGRRSDRRRSPKLVSS